MLDSFVVQQTGHVMWSMTVLLLPLLLCCIAAEMNSSQVRTLPPTMCPSVCFCDKTNYVNCVGDGLWDVPTSEIPRTVVRLELRNYAISLLSMYSVQELTELVELKLQQTKIESIENGTFSNLTRLLRLDLSQNLIEAIGGTMFEGLGNLRYLDLSTNRVTKMDEAFVDLVNLEQLNLRENLLPGLSVVTFSGLYKVQYLNLDSNRIVSIEVGTFQYLTNLAHLIVSNNPLMALSRLDFFGSRLQYIDVSRVELTRVPQSLTRYVRDLRLAKNNLTHVRLGDFDSYPYLSLLVLDDNFLVDIESDALGRQEYLVRLWLNGNSLTQIPANLPPSLRVLYVEENLLKVLSPYCFQGLVNLEQLFLQRNQIRRLDKCAFCDLQSLHHLDLQANLLETIHEGAFANLSNLISLDLSQNPLKLLSDGCFIGLDFLKTLQLSRMKTQLLFEGSVFDPLKKLESLELYDSPAFTASLVNATRALQGLRSLRELNVMHNNLVSLRSDFPHFFPQLKVAKLSGNRWHCDATILWLTDWVKKADTHFDHSYSIRCSQPPQLLYKPIMMLKMEDFALAIPTKQSTTTVNTKVITATEIPRTVAETFTTVASYIYRALTSSLQTVPSVSKSHEDENTEIVRNSTKPDTKIMSEISTIKSTLSTAKLISALPTSDFPKTTVTTAADLTTATSTFNWTAMPLKPDTMDNTTVNKPAQSNDSQSKVNTTIEESMTHVYLIPELESTSTEDSILRDGMVSDPSVDYVEHQNNSRIVVAVLLTIGLGLLLLGLVVTFLLFRYRKRHNAMTSSLDCQMRRSSSSISYSPQRDEVSIISVSDGTVGLHTITHQGLSNKLYFVLENGSDSSSSRQLVKDAIPDPSLHELLPETMNCYPTVRHKKLSAKKFRSYCFDK